MFTSEVLTSKNIQDNITDISHFGYDVSFRELEFRRGQMNYDKLCDRLIECDRPVDYKKYPVLALEEIKQLVLEIYDQLFDEYYHDIIESYGSLVQTMKIDEPFDAVIEHDIHGDDDRIKSIFISDKCSVVEVPCLAHEYMHGLLLKYNTNLFNRVISNYHYDELLPIIIEYLASYYLDDTYTGIVDYNSGIRLRANAINAKDKMDVQDLIRTHRISLTDYSDIIDYQSHNLFTYIICDMYASYLASIRDVDLIDRLKNVIDGSSSIADSIIKPYNLSLINKDVLDHYYKKMN